MARWGCGGQVKQQGHRPAPGLLRVAVGVGGGALEAPGAVGCWGRTCSTAHVGPRWGGGSCCSGAP